MFLEVRPSNEIALSLYRSEGFVEVGYRRSYYRGVNGREDALVLALELER
jgi:ribosomal-protein-alanine N-acetyltransferase